MVLRVWSVGALRGGLLARACKVLGETSDDESDMRLQSAHELATVAQPAQWPKRAGRVENAWQIRRDR